MSSSDQARERLRILIEGLALAAGTGAQPWWQEGFRPRAKAAPLYKV